MSNFKISTLRTGDIIRPRRGVITFGFVKGNNQISNTTQQNIRYIFKSLIEPFVNVRFVEKRNGDSDINFQLHNYPNFYAYELEHDVYLRRSNDNSVGVNAFQGGVGSYGFETLIHETLHALGLKHPGNYNGDGPGRGPFLPYSLDNNSNTLMSYNTGGKNAGSPMSFDISALQAIYGEGKLNRGNTTYRFGSIHSFSDGRRSWGTASVQSKLTLLDDGGSDMTDFTGLGYSASGYVLDAREGGIFTTGAAYNSASYRPRDANRQNTPLQQTTSYGTWLAADTEIEKITGSRSNDFIYAGKKTQRIDGYGGDDYIVGNDGSEILWGNMGKDEIYGGKGKDQLIGGSGGRRESDPGSRDLLYGGEGKDTLYGEGGNDALYGQEGDDIIYGGSGNDYIAGTSEKRTRDGKARPRGDRDKLYGGDGRDYFVLGEKQGAFYRGSGYAIIKDWESGFDKLQLGRGGGRYTFDSKRMLGGRSLDGVVYHNKDLIGVVEDIGNSGLSQSDFVLA